MALRTTYATSPLARSVLALGALGWTCIAHAELAVGSFANPGQVRIFANGAAGNAPPLLTIGGAATGLQTPASMAFDPDPIEMFVSDYYGQAIRVFDPRQTGDRPPIRTLSLPTRPGHIIVNAAFSELTFVASGVYTYPIDSDGTPSAPKRVIDWGGTIGSVTLLDQPAGLVAVASASADELVVGDYDTSMGGEILAFARAASGNVAPVREIRGSLTALGSYVADLAFDRARCELYALAAVESGAFHIAVFYALDAGNVAPLRVIEGPSTLLDGAGGIGFDAENDRLWVTTGYDGGTPRLLAFSPSANGDVAPVVVIEGSATGLSVPYGVLPYQLPNPIFGDGFESGLASSLRPLAAAGEELCVR